MSTPKELIRQFDIKDLDNYLVCSVCDGYYRYAHTLSECGHSFCYVCVKQLQACSKCGKSLSNTTIRKDPYLQNIVDLVHPQFGKEDQMLIHRMKTLFPGMVDDQGLVNLLEEKEHGFAKRKKRMAQDSLVSIIQNSLGANWEDFKVNIQDEKAYNKYLVKLGKGKIEIEQPENHKITLRGMSDVDTKIAKIGYQIKYREKDFQRMRLFVFKQIKIEECSDLINASQAKVENVQIDDYCRLDCFIREGSSKTMTQQLNYMRLINKRSLLDMTFNLRNEIIKFIPFYYGLWTRDQSNKSQMKLQYQYLINTILQFFNSTNKRLLTYYKIKTLLNKSMLLIMLYEERTQKYKNLEFIYMKKITWILFLFYYLLISVQSIVLVSSQCDKYDIKQSHFIDYLDGCKIKQCMIGCILCTSFNTCIECQQGTTFYSGILKQITGGPKCISLFERDIFLKKMEIL
ncbi:hypothetical protein pb186bvf_004342 [Paramecium bursaria]